MAGTRKKRPAAKIRPAGTKRRPGAPRPGNRDSIPPQTHHVLPPGRIAEPKHPWRTLAWIAGSLTVLLGVLWFASTSGMVANQFKPKLETELSKVLNRTVTIEHLEGGLFDRVVLRRVRIASPPLTGEALDITIDRVVVQYSLWDLLVRKKSLADSLREIQLITPQIPFERRPDGSWLSPNLTQWAARDAPSLEPVPIPRIRIRLIGGEFSFKTPKSKARIKHIHGMLNIQSPERARLSLSGRTAESRLANVWLDGNLNLLAGQFQIDFTATRVDLPTVGRITEPSAFFEVESGYADLELHVRSRRSRPDDLVPGLDIQGELGLDQVALRIPGLDEPLHDINGSARLENGRLIVKQLKAMLGRTSWTGAGSLADLKDPQIHLQVKNERLALDQLAQAIPRLASLRTSGLGSAVFLIKGKLPEVAVTATLGLEQGKIGNIPVRDLESILRFHRGELRVLLARGQVAGGRISGGGRILLPSGSRPGAVLDLAVNGEELKVEDMLAVQGLAQLSGRVSGQVRLTGDANAPVLQGTVTAPRLRAPGGEGRNLSGTFRIDAGLVQARTRLDWDRLPGIELSLELHRRGGEWRVNEARAQQAGRTLLRLSGQWGTGPPGTLALSASLRKFPLESLSVWPSPIKSWKGLFDADVRVFGTNREPCLVGTVRSARLGTSNGTGIDLLARWMLTKDQLRVLELKADQGRIGLSGAYGFSDRALDKAALDLDRARLGALAALAGIGRMGNWQGEMTGKVRAAGRIAALRTQGNLNLRDLRWSGERAAQGELQFTTTGNQIWVKTLTLRQPGGRFSADLEAQVAGNSLSAFRLNAWMDNFTLFKRAWSGEAQAAGQPQATPDGPVVAGQIAVRNWQSGSSSLDDLTAKVRYTSQNGVWSLTDLKWGNEITASGRWRSAAPAEGRLELAAGPGRLESLRLLLWPEAKPMAEPVRAQVQVLMDPNGWSGSMNLELAQGRCQGELTGPWSAKPADTRWHGKFAFTNFQLDHLNAWPASALKVTLPKARIQGKLEFMSAKGALNALAGQLTFFDLTHGYWKFNRLEVDAVLQNRTWEIRRCEGVQPLGSFKLENTRAVPKGEAEYALTGDLKTKQFYFFSRFFTGDFKLNGTLGLKPQTALRLDLSCPDFTLNRFNPGALRLGLNLEGASLKFTSPPDLPYQIQGDLSLLPNGAVRFNRLEVRDRKDRAVTATGRIDLEGTSALDVTVRDVPANIIARSLNWPQPWTGVTNGTFRYTDPDHIPYMQIAVKVENGSVLGLAFDRFIGNILVDHDWLYFQGPDGALRLQREGLYQMRLSGKLPLPTTEAAAIAMRSDQLDIRVDMPEGDLAFLTFIPYFSKAGGKSSLKLAIRGTMDNPSLNGTAKIFGGTLQPRIYTPRLEDVQADLLFDDNRVFIQRLDAKMGENRLFIAPGPAAPFAAVFSRLEPDQLNLHVHSGGRRVRLDNTPDHEFVSAQAVLDLNLTGTYAAPVLGGTLEVSDGQFTFPTRPLTDIARSWKDNRMRYNGFTLRTRNNLWFYNDVVRAQLQPNGSVTLSGGARDFAADGKIAVNRGTFTYLDAAFNLDASEETAITFSGKDKPRLDALAKTVIRNVRIKDEGEREATIYLRARGEIGTLKMQLYSEPTLTQAQIISLLTVGEDYSSWSAQELDQKVQSAGARVLGRWAGNLLGREIEKNIRRIAPVDVVGIRLGGVERLADNIVAGSGSNTGAANNTSVGTSLLQDMQIDVGKYLTDDLYLNYRATLKDRGATRGGMSLESLLGVEYDLDASRKLRFYKDFDADSGQEFFLGIEGRTRFEGWSPAEWESNTPPASSEKIE